MWAASAFALGVFGAGRIEPFGLAIVAAAAALAAGRGRLRRCGGRLLWPYLALLAAGALRTGLLGSARPANDLKSLPLPCDPVVAFGRVALEPELRNRHLLVTFAVDSLKTDQGSLACAGRVRVRLPHATPVACGEYLALRGRLVRPRSGRNPGDFDFASYLARRDIFAELLVESDRPVAARGRRTGDHPIGGVVAACRRWIYAQVGCHLRGEPAALILGLLFGERHGLSAAMQSDFRRTGTLHLLAVSGSNVAVVVGVVWGALAFLRIPRPGRYLATGPVLLLFAALARHEPSVLRASVAAALALSGRALGRPTDGINLWGATLLALLLWDPRQLYDVGFQLSFAAALGILAGAAHFRLRAAKRGLWRRCARLLWQAIGVTLCAQIACLPVLAAAFNEVPLVAPASNLIAVPLAGMTTGAGLMLVLLSPLGGAVRALLAGAAWALSQALLWAVRWVAGFEAAIWRPPTPSAAEAAVYYLLVVLVLAFLSRPPLRRRILFTALVVLQLAVWPSAIRGRRTLEIAILDAGGQSVSLFRWPDGTTWMLAGDVVGSPTWERVLTPFLHRHGWSHPAVVLHLQRSSGEPADLNLAAGRVGTQAGKAAAVNMPPLRNRYRATVYLARDSRACVAVRIQAPAWAILWVSSERLLDRLLPDLTVPVWAVLPALPWNTGDILSAYPTLTLIESGRPETPAGAVAPGSARVVRILTVGGIMTSDRGGGPRLETSMR